VKCKSFLVTIYYSSHDNEQEEPEWATSAYYIEAEDSIVAVQKCYAYALHDSVQKEEYREAQGRNRLQCKAFFFVPSSKATLIHENIEL